MKKIIILIGIFLLIPLVSADLILNLEYQIFKDDNVEKKDLRLIQGRETGHITEGDYTIEILDEDNEIIYSQDIAVHFQIFTNPPTPTNDSLISLRIKYEQEMDKLNIYNQDNLIYEEEIVLCNYNGICEIEKGENYLSCPEDCPLHEPDGICIPNLDGICDPDCAPGVDPDCEEIPEETTTTTITTTTTLQQDEKGNNNLILYVIGSIIIIVLVLFLLFRKKEEKDDYSEILNRLQK